MPTVTAPDGTTIGYETTGAGAPLILVDGAFGSRTFGPNGALATLLAERFTVVTYDRRGRGASDDKSRPGPEGVRREVEDLTAVIGAVGGPAYVYGISSGAALALEAARTGAPISRLALFEAPFIVDDTRPAVPADYARRIDELLQADRRGQAVGLFMSQGVGLNPVIVAMMRLMPAWSGMKAVAHTLPYDVAVTVDLQHGTALPADRWATVNCPVLVLDGGKSPAWMRNGMAALAAALPNANSATLPGQTHLVKPAALAPALIDFFTAPASTPPQPGQPTMPSGPGRG